VELTTHLEIVFNTHGILFVFYFRKIAIQENFRSEWLEEWSTILNGVAQYC